MFPWQRNIDIKEFFKIVNLHKQKEGDTNCYISFINIDRPQFVALTLATFSFFAASHPTDTTNHVLSNKNCYHSFGRAARALHMVWLFFFFYSRKVYIVTFNFSKPIQKYHTSFEKLLPISPLLFIFK